MHLIQLTKERAEAEKASTSASAAEVAQLLCPALSCKSPFSSVKDFGNHFVDAHGLAIFGRDAHFKHGEPLHWDGKLSSLARTAKDTLIGERRSAKKARKEQHSKGGNEELDEAELDEASIPM